MDNGETRRFEQANNPPLDPDRPGHRSGESRSVRRRTISAEVKLRRSGELSFLVHAYDLSEHGCKIEFIERPRLDELVWVKFPGLESIESSVKWVGKYVLGLKFTKSIDPRVLQVLLQQLS